jgi:hypothetical protein
MPKTVITIPGDWPVFVLEDNQERIAWFRKRVPQAIIVENASEAMVLLAQGDFKMAFLDHDLGDIDAAYPDRFQGKEVAQYLACSNFSGIVVIHSLNTAGAKAMKAHLKDARIVPFGTFEIESG